MEESVNNNSISSISDTENPAAPKRQKLGEEIETSENEGEDRISKLPDSVLRHILSFIGMKFAARTSAVAKRWIDMWLSPSSIVILDDSVRLNTENPVNLAAFMNYVDKVLLFHDDNNDDKSVIKLLKLNCEAEGYDLWRVSSWVSIIAEFDIEHLELDFGIWNVRGHLELPRHLSRLPISFFNRDRLVKMHLAYLMFHVPSRVNYPNLKTLVLYCVNLLGDNPMKKLVSGCPVLESLELTNASWDSDETVNIESSTVNDLYLDSKLVPIWKNQKIVVRAPNIAVLHLSGKLEYDYDLGDLSALKSFWLRADRDGLVLPDTNVLSDRLIALLEKVSHVEELVLYKPTVRFLEHASFDNVPMFHNLKVLKVEIADFSWRILPPLLERSPNLVLFASYNLFEEGEESASERGWDPPHCVPKCLVSSLEVVEFDDFDNDRDEIEMIQYFLKNAIVLKEIKITFRDFRDERLPSIISEVVMFPGSSKDCRLTFSLKAANVVRYSITITKDPCSSSVVYHK